MDVVCDQLDDIYLTPTDFSLKLRLEPFFAVEPLVRPERMGSA